MNPRKYSPIVLAGIGGIVVGTLSLGAISASGASTSAGPPPQPVTVTNTPLPVQGNIGVNNFPATQAVSGTVNIGNLPTTQQVSGNVGIVGTPTVNETAKTTLIAHGRATLPANGTTNVGLPGLVDTSLYKSIKAAFFCISPQDCSAATLITATPDPVGGGLFGFDYFHFPANTFGVLRDYANPGTGLQFLANNTSSTSITVDYAIYGRTN